MKLIKYGTRIMVTISSLGAFTVGWAFLAHAQKPAPIVQPAAQVEPLPTLAPIPSLGQLQERSFQQIQPQFQSRFSSPRLRTGGS